MKLTYTISDVPVVIEGTPEEVSAWVSLQAEKVRDREARSQDETTFHAAETPAPTYKGRAWESFRHRTDAILQILNFEDDDKLSTEEIWTRLVHTNVLRLITTVKGVKSSLSSLRRACKVENTYDGDWEITNRGIEALRDAPWSAGYRPEPDK